MGVGVGVLVGVYVSVIGDTVVGGGGIGIGDGVKVGVLVGSGVFVGTGVGVGVNVGVWVGVLVGEGVSVGVRVAVSVGVEVSVEVGTEVPVKAVKTVGDEVAVNVGVLVATERDAASRHAKQAIRHDNTATTPNTGFGNGLRSITRPAEVIWESVTDRQPNHRPSSPSNDSAGLPLLLLEWRGRHALCICRTEGAGDQLLRSRTRLQ